MNQFYTAESVTEGHPDIPVHYEHPARVPEQKKTRKQKEPER